MILNYEKKIYTKDNPINRGLLGWSINTPFFFVGHNTDDKSTAFFPTSIYIRAFHQRLIRIPPIVSSHSKGDE